MPGLIVKTKFYKPRVRAEMVTRPHLVERLNEGLSCKLVLVSAPAGFGKTTLVSEWLQQLAFPVAWLSLDQEDNHLVRFVAYLVNALREIEPSVGESLLELLKAPQQPTMETMMGMLVNDLVVLPYKVVLVLDDFHLIKNPVIHEALIVLMQFMPENMGDQGFHLVLTTRTDPTFPLSRWRLQRQMVEIRARDLRFSNSEVTTFLNEIIGLNLQPGEIQALETCTEGWIAGLQLAAVSMQGRSEGDVAEFIRAFTGDNRYIADYLVEEVLDQQADSIKDFLLQTSILDRLTGALCDAVTQKPGSQAILEELERVNLFIVPLDDQRGWYRYHQLFSDLLVYRLQFYPQRQIHQLHARAAAWMEEHDLIEEAFKHWQKADNFAEAARLVAKVAPLLLAQSQFFLLRDLIESFPQSAFARWPWLCIYLAWTFFILQPETVEKCLKCAEQSIVDQQLAAIEPEETRLMHGNIAAVRAICAARRGDVKETFLLVPQAFAFLPEDDDKVRGLVMYALSTAQAMKGNLDQALDNCLQAEKVLRHGGNLAASVDALSLAGGIQMIQGKLCAAKKTFQEAIRLSQQKGAPIFSSASMSYTALGQLLYEWNQLKPAFENLERGRELGEQWGFSQRVSGYVCLALAYLNSGNLPQAKAIMDDYEKINEGHALLLESESLLAACRLRLLSDQKDFDAANQLVESRQLDDFIDVSVIREPEGIALLQYYMQRGEFESVVELASRLSSRMAQGGRYGRLINVLSLQAVALRLLGQHKEALDVLLEVLSLAHPENYVRTFIDSGKPMRELLVEAALSEKGELKAYISRLLTAFDEMEQLEVENAPLKISSFVGDGGETGSLSLVEPLSEHEQKVLRLLAAGQTNREIASELTVSINTVKTHTANIYRKLDVHNRTQASHRAKSLGLL